MELSQSKFESSPLEPKPLVRQPNMFGFWSESSLSAEACCNVSVLYGLVCGKLTVSLEDASHSVTRTGTPFPLPSL